ncbi:MAG: helix-turn-helix transcriptional regulator [Sphingobacteriales bacterium]|nr:helix-turn-helix transcriptional regulator [Sphingobacteriales bacterium]MBI3718163.1 helix-turn-helix transcriptional regulator [Sphingobacteriales bacterium]
MKELGNRIRDLRLQKGMSQLDLGITIDNYAEQIGRIERGELNVSICTLRLIAKGLQIPLHELLNF